MNTTPQQMQQQHAMIRNQAHALLSQFKSTTPHSQFTQTIDHQVRALDSMLAAGKSQATIDAHMKLMNRTIVDAQKQAYAHHAAPQAGHYGGTQAQFGQAGHQYGHGQLQGNAGHVQPAGQTGMTPQQSSGHFTPVPSVRTLENARAAVRNMSKIGHNGNALF